MQKGLSQIRLWQISIFVMVLVFFVFLLRERTSCEETCPFFSPTLLTTEVLGSLLRCASEVQIPPAFTYFSAEPCDCIHHLQDENNLNQGAAAV